MIKFSVNVGNHRISFIFDHLKARNWKISIGQSVWRYSLDFEQTITILSSNKSIWCQALFSLISDASRFGLHLRKKYRVVGQMYLNWFGLPSTKKDLEANPDYPKFLSCDRKKGKHQLAPDIPRCLSCGIYVPNIEDEEEEEDAKICDCGLPEEECDCVGCDFCGEKKDCECLICENADCGRCTCKDKFHWKKHKLADCHCEPPCTPKQHKKKHERLKCECASKLCPDCDGELPDGCDCPDDESSCEYEC